MPKFSKKEFSEQDICSKFILPALTNAGWDLQKQIREQYGFTAGRIIVRGKTVFRGEKKRADFVLYHRGHLPLAIIEAKDNKHPVGAGMQQALEYAEALDIPFVYSSNGDAFLEHNRLVKTEPIEREIKLNEFPSTDTLYNRYVKAKGFIAEQEKVISQDYYQEIDGKSPRYFQQVAINRATEEIVRGKNRLLLVMATGTGKTYAAFQIIWRLWKAGVKKRILFLVDRNILADQPIMNDFRHFGDKMTKIQNRQVDKAYEVCLGLYQGLAGMEEKKISSSSFRRTFLIWSLLTSVIAEAPAKTVLGGRFLIIIKLPLKSASLPHPKKQPTFQRKPILAIRYIHTHCGKVLKTVSLHPTKLSA